MDKLVMRGETERLSVAHTPHTIGGWGYTHSIPNYGRVIRGGLDAVVGSDDKKDEVGNGSSPGAHFRKGLVTWGIDKSYLFRFAFEFFLDLVGIDVLRDAAEFALGEVLSFYFGE